MGPGQEGQPHSNREAVDLISAVKELHRIPPQELGEMLKDSETFALNYFTEKGVPFQIDVEKLARFLPLHLIAVLIASNRDESLLKYMLCGFRLLHSLCDLASRQTKLEQVLFDDVKVSEQLLDLIFHMIIVLSNCRQENQATSRVPLIHSSLVACTLYLLPQCISPQWQGLVPVLLSHPKVDIFMDAAFRALYLDVNSLQIKLSDQCIDYCTKSSPTAEKSVSYLCQQCESSLQFLQTLCQQKIFRERLIRNKELSGKGGVLLLAHSILKLNISPLYIEYSTVVASVSRLKSKVLSILLILCELENISFLDEAFRTSRGQDLAKSVASQILELLRTALNRDNRHLRTHSNRTYPMGISQLNALRLADIFSDDSNFRSHIAVHFTEVVAAIFIIPQGDFLSTWCSSCPPLREEDTALEYDAFAAAGWVLDSSSDINHLRNSEFSFIPNNIRIPHASYSLQRTALLVKVIANLHCFVPKICKDNEKNLFLNKFIMCLGMDQPGALPQNFSTSDAQKASTICKNMRSLLSHSESLIPIFLNVEDVQLFRIFFNQLLSLIAPGEPEVNRLQEARSFGRCSSTQLGRIPLQNNNNLKEEMSENSFFRGIERDCSRGDRSDRNRHGASKENNEDFPSVDTSGSNSNSPKRKASIRRTNYNEYLQSNEHVLDNNFEMVQGDEELETIRSEEEKKNKKRKRTIMSDEQMSAIEMALVDEPGMQRNSASLQAWADKLCSYGPEVTVSQLKNWLNNRKARLARAAAKGGRRPVSDSDHPLPEKQGVSGAGSLEISQDSPGEDPDIPTATRGTGSASRTDATSKHIKGEDLAIPTTATRGTGSASRTDATSKNIKPPYTEPAVFPSLREPGQHVVILDDQGGEIGTGKVYQVKGKWYGMSLEDTGRCVLDIIELKLKKWMKLPYPSEATGSTFDEAEAKIGLVRVLWDSCRTYMVRRSSGTV